MEFRRILDGQQKTFASSTAFNSVPYRFHVKRKECNIIGLQIADLIARPIGNNYFRSNQPNRSYDIIKDKNQIHRLKDAEMVKIYS